MSTRRGRLTSSGDFDRVYRQGKSAVSDALVVYCFDREPGEAVRLGLSVSKKIGKAVVRNRVKRVMRDAFWRLSDGQIGDGRDYVLVAKTGIVEVMESRGQEGVFEELRTLMQKYE